MPAVGETSDIYVVNPDDTLSGIALRYLGSAHRWTEIARLNGLSASDPILIGQQLRMPQHVRQPPVCAATPITGAAHADMPLADRPATIVPGLAYHFVVADEWNPFARKLVRKVLTPPEGALDPAALERILNPDRAGFAPRGAGTNVSMGRHLGGMTNSRYISASERMLGSPRFAGERYWIDAEIARRHGAQIHESPLIIADLDRVIAKQTDAARKAALTRIRDLSIRVDREVLIEGHVPPAAIKGGVAMGLTRTMQVVSGVGIILTAYDLKKATDRSYAVHSVRPLAAETVRQMGGWGGALAGAKIGAVAGAAVGIETGPGAVITGLVGGVIFGIAGYTGADWVAGYIDTPQ